jgi:hypothetical protein
LLAACLLVALVNPGRAETIVKKVKAALPDFDWYIHADR